MRQRPVEARATLRCMRGGKRLFSSFVVACVAAFAIATSAPAMQPAEEDLPPIEEIEVDPSITPVRVRDDHDPTRAAHPLRIVGYVLHPVGVTLDWLLVRPAVWAVRHEPFRTIFGYQD